jgi:hypothetical protein
MTGDDYRVKVAELRARASEEADPARRAEFESLAQAYLRLAAQAKRNTETDVTYEPPPPKISTPGPR